MRDNSRITKQERGLIKGALRRVFSRSELRRQALELIRVDYTDPARPRVKKWGRCSSCKELTPLYLIDVDHKIPVQPVDKTLLELSSDDIVNALWCELQNLQGLCQICHKAKTKLEASLRRQLRSKKKDEPNKKATRRKPNYSKRGRRAA